jgi:hypothetical protein
MAGSSVGAFDQLLDCAESFSGIFDDSGRFVAVRTNVISLDTKCNDRLADIHWDRRI